jgi:DNA-binding response OmpR family regulator
MTAPQAASVAPRERPDEERESGMAGWSTALLIEPRLSIRAGLIRELRRMRMDPVPLEPDLSGSGLAPLSEGAGPDRPVLVADQEGARRMIAMIRRSGHDNPIIAYQDFRRSDRIIALLDSGADQVISLPLRGVELEARIMAIRRRAYGTAQAQITTGPLTIPLDRRPPMIGDKTLKIPEAEAALLRHLALNLGKPVSRDQLYDRLYEASDTKPFPRILDRYVCNIRRRIAERWPEGPDRIRTVSGYGYALLAGPLLTGERPREWG